jgi:hypothetical protein
VNLVVRSVAAIAAVYVLLAGGVALAMLQPPERFGQIAKHVPEALVWGVLPGKQLWLWARGGAVAEGALAPDFTLPTHKHDQQVTLSSFRGDRPVVLVFGSYT